MNDEHLVLENVDVSRFKHLPAEDTDIQELGVWQSRCLRKKRLQQKKLRHQYPWWRRQTKFLRWPKKLLKEFKVAIVKVVEEVYAPSEEKEVAPEEDSAALLFLWRRE